jgi:prepilin-type N-terminal cleavage/methylation domain-containing protein
MFRVIGKLKSDKRGFTLVELLVTMSVLLIALTLTAELLGIIWQNYRKVEYRWVVQTAVDYVAGCFQRDANLEALATADECDLYYEAMPTAGTDTNTPFTLECAPELGTIVYNPENHTLTLDAQSLSDEQKEILTTEKNIYFISYDQHFYNIRYDNLFSSTTSGTVTTYEYYEITKNPIAQNLNLIDAKEADVQISVDFSVSGNPLGYDSATHSESKPGVNGQAYTKYLPAGVTATITGTIQDANLVYEHNTTELVSTIDLQNIDTNKGEGVNKQGGYLSSVYVAGWDKGDNIKYAPGYDGTPDAAADGAPSNPTLPANVIKYHSVNTPKDDMVVQVQDDEFDINVTMSPCLLRFASTGLENQKEVLKPIREFRDNVLKGNWLGDKIIDVYYNSVSPLAVKVMTDVPVLRAVMQEVTVDLSSTLSLIE